jgi:hypothetical protein
VEGWGGVWVSAFAGELRAEWFPAPGWAAEAFGRLRAANGGRLGGFFDVFAWREPGQLRFLEAKVGPDRIRPNQRRFFETALRFHAPDQFVIVEIAR